MDAGVRTRLIHERNYFKKTIKGVRTSNWNWIPIIDWLVNAFINWSWIQDMDNIDRVADINYWNNFTIFAVLSIQKLDSTR